LTEGRYLLFRALDDSVAVFDGWNMTEYQAEFIAKHRGILLVDIVLVYCRTHAVARRCGSKNANHTDEKSIERKENEAGHWKEIKDKDKIVGVSDNLN
jgi:hypothetical protein